MAKFRLLAPGDPAPWFHQRTTTNPRYAFDSVGGRYIVLCFFASAAAPHSKAALEAVNNHPDIFNDAFACFFGVSNDPTDEKENRLKERIPGYRYFWDFDGTVAKAYGAIPVEADKGAKVPVDAKWVILDPTLRVMNVIRFEKNQAEIAKVIAYLNSLPPPQRFTGFDIQAPILILPNVFEPEFCQQLISLYEKHGGEDSGFMREIGGKTTLVHDHHHKRRKDHVIEDDAVIKETQNRIIRRIVPEIAKVHQFHVTRMERYIVCCYAAEDAAHFNSHRDNTTSGTAHRRFAVSINLNEDFDGGEVSFPEYGPRSFKPPAGGAVVFSCSLLHRVSEVTRGRRYAFLPFLYDDAAARIREANNKQLAEGIAAYKG